MFIVFWRCESYGADEWTIDYQHAEVPELSDGQKYVDNLNKLADLLDSTKQFTYRFIKCVRLNQKVSEEMKYRDKHLPKGERRDHGIMTFTGVTQETYNDVRRHKRGEEENHTSVQDRRRHRSTRETG